MKTIPAALFLLSSVLLAACSPRAPTVSPEARPEGDREAAVRAIRAIVDGADAALQVTPLRDPAVEGFLGEAERAEQQRRYDDAHAAIARARALAPDAPDLIQHEAEIEFLRGNIVEAEKLAWESYRKGPQLGALCARNWQTAVEARRIFKDPDYEATAAARRDACKVKRPVRL